MNWQHYFTHDYPKTCEICSAFNCGDSEVDFENPENGPDTINSAIVAANSILFCPGGSITQTCKETCGYCDGTTSPPTLEPTSAPTSAPTSSPTSAPTSVPISSSTLARRY